MIRTTVVGSWPPEERNRSPLARYFRGQMGEPESESLLKEVAAVAIAQQQACGLDEYTGGETSADSFILHFPRLLTGIEPTDQLDAWGGRGSYSITGPLGAPRGLGVAAAFRRERAIDPLVKKVTVPGPSEITTMLEPREAGQRAWPTVVDLIRAEIRELIQAGASDVQLDVPQIAMGLADGGWETVEAVDTIGAIFEGFTSIRRSIHLCYGDFGARTWVRNRAFRPLLPTIQALGGIVDRVVLELSLPEQWAERHLLAEIPSQIEIAAGIVDVKDPRVQTAAELGGLAEQLLTVVPSARLLLCPSCGLGRRTVELAVAKVTAMVVAARSI
jgi:5-methyltetrahydropteroyltriglutamate--homocysteine methyltransferase